MKKDTQVKLLMQERRRGTSQRLAAARAGMSERTARKYEQAGQLPSHLKRPHIWTTRANPFEEHWPWVIAQLERDPALQGSTLFALRMSSTIQAVIDRPKSGPYSDISLAGGPCMDQSTK